MTETVRRKTSPTRGDSAVRRVSSPPTRACRTRRRRRHPAPGIGPETDDAQPPAARVRTAPPRSSSSSAHTWPPDVEMNRRAGPAVRARVTPSTCSAIAALPARSSTRWGFRAPPATAWRHPRAAGTCTQRRYRATERDFRDRGPRQTRHQPEARAERLAGQTSAKAAAGSRGAKLVDVASRKHHAAAGLMTPTTTVHRRRR